MRFFNIDYHVSVIEDITRIFNRLGHQVVSHNCTGHAWVFGRVTKPTFGGVSNENYLSKDPEEFRREHPELEHFDGFISCFPPGMAEVFSAYDKPLIMVIPIRYEYGAQNNPDRWNKLNDWIRSASASGQLHMVANSVYDQQYTAHFTGVTPRYIPSMCDYFDIQYNPVRDTALLWDTRSSAVDQHVLANVPGVQALRATYPHYEQQTVAEHKAVIYIPYNASVMSMFERYSSNQPIFAPTPEHLLHLRKHYNALNELSFYQSQPEHDGGTKIDAVSNAPDPNRYNDPEALLHWMPTYDIYNLPHIQLFDSMEELSEMLGTTDLRAVSEQMAHANLDRRRSIEAAWEDVLQGVVC